jgi:endonuclease YncB( thermonuclease family)
MQRGKYFRIVADVYADNQSLADELIKNNLAVRYNGGTKVKDWCK